MYVLYKTHMLTIPCFNLGSMQLSKIAFFFQQILIECFIDVKQYAKDWHCLLLKKSWPKNYISISFLLCSCYVCWYVYGPSMFPLHHSASCPVCLPEYFPLRNIHYNINIGMWQSLRSHFNFSFLNTTDLNLRSR